MLYIRTTHFSAWLSNGRKPAPLKTLEIGAGKIQFDLSHQKDSIETIVLGDGVTEIPASFAAGCTNLTSVSLLGRLDLGAIVFKGCSSLKKIEVFLKTRSCSLSAMHFRIVP